MKTSSYTLLPATTFGSAVENYDGVATTFSGNASKAAAYYSKSKSIQTASWHLTGFVGYLLVEGTLDADADTANYTSIHSVGDGATPLTESDFVNLTGNYTWIRATVTDFASGAINSVSLGY